MMRVGGEQLWAVYQHLDIDGDVLYVGMTGELDKRTRAHEQSSPWMLDVVEVDVLAYYDDREKAAAAELAAIRKYDPPNNIRGTSRAERVPDTHWLSTVVGVEAYLKQSHEPPAPPELSLEERMQECIAWADEPLDVSEAWFTAQEQNTERAS